MKEKSTVIGTIEMYFPDIGDKTYWIYEDFAELFNTETTVEAIKIVKKEIKRAEIKGRVSIDEEADGASISTRKGETMLAVVQLINRLINPSFTIKNDVLIELKERIKKHKVPKGQSFEVGDLLAIPIDQNKYSPAQIIEINEGYGLVCLFFDGVYSSVDEMQQGEYLTKEKVFAAATFSDLDVLNYTFQVVDREKEKIAQVIHNGRRNRLAEEIIPDSAVIELFENRVNAISDEEQEYNRMKLKYVEWL